LGESASDRNTTTRLDGLGLSVPIPTARGSLVFGIGYSRVRDFDDVLYVSAFQGSAGDSVTWEHERYEEGGLGRTTLGGAVEVAPGLYMGVGLNFWSGKDDYTWRFRELDRPYNIWTFDTYESVTQIYTGFNGINGSVGLMYSMGAFSVGGVIESPLNLNGEEEWEYFDETVFDDGSSYLDTTDAGLYEYEIEFPWIFRFGASVKAGPAMVTGDMAFKNYSQIRYNTPTSVAGMSQGEVNMMLRRQFRNVLDVAVGAEVRVPGTDLALRGGYSHHRSPYAEGYGPEGARTVISLGAGVTLMKSLVLDGVYAWTSWDGDEYEVYDGNYVQGVQTDAGKFMISLRYLM
jgi:hypothetical protein